MMKRRLLTTRPARLTTLVMMALSLTAMTAGVMNVQAAVAPDSATAARLAVQDKLTAPAHDHSGMDHATMKMEAGDQNPAVDPHHGKTPPAGVVLEPPKLDRSSPMPKQYENVDVVEHRGDQLPMDLRFTDEHGNEVRLGDFFKKDRPVILDLAYYDCPMLCDVVMNGLSDVVKELGWTPGKNFEIVTISIDPRETSALATAKKKTYMEELGKVGNPDGWHFLTGDQNNITAIAEAVGFKYKWLDHEQQFAHPAVLTIVTPDGHISRYLYGVKFPVNTLKYSLITASNGKVGSALDRLIITCCQIDLTTGKYTVSAMRLMAAGGGLTLTLLAGGIIIALVREYSRRRRNRLDALNHPNHRTSTSS